MKNNEKFNPKCVDIVQGDQKADCTRKFVTPACSKIEKRFMYQDVQFCIWNKSGVLNLKVVKFKRFCTGSEKYYYAKKQKPKQKNND